MKAFSVILLVAVLVCGLQARPQYLDLLPNSRNVVDCDGENWPGFGHYNRWGAGTNNAFGSDFAVAGRKWTEAFCNADSDGDGLSNGQELGDPECVWRVGEKPSRTEDITHPGRWCQPRPKNSE
ncbi:temptin precursor [Elysia marginata]|uniref:Temptin n=1 Tax=Elysia marginata TaxID=1093978 RepID=A0AAV4IV79_9GAST|nr:temptin precursor [Elysia marginata]